MSPERPLPAGCFSADARRRTHPPPPMLPIVAMRPCRSGCPSHSSPRRTSHFARIVSRNTRYPSQYRAMPGVSPEPRTQANAISYASKRTGRIRRDAFHSPWCGAVQRRHTYARRQDECGVRSNPTMPSCEQARSFAQRSLSAFDPTPTLRRPQVSCRRTGEQGETGSRCESTDSIPALPPQR